jgi:hypothetical protein
MCVLLLRTCLNSTNQTPSFNPQGLSTTYLGQLCSIEVISYCVFLGLQGSFRINADKAVIMIDYNESHLANAGARLGEIITEEVRRRLRSNLQVDASPSEDLLEDGAYQVVFSYPWKRSSPFYSQDGQLFSESDLPGPSDLIAAYKSEKGNAMETDELVQAIWVSLVTLTRANYSDSMYLADLTNLT